MAERALSDHKASAVTPQALLAALRDAGAEQIDPVRLHYLAVLARRMPTAPPAVQAVLQPRWQMAWADLEGRCREACRRADAQPVPGPPADPPLAALNHYIRSASHAAAALGAAPEQVDDGSELRSLRGFRESWSRIAAVEQVDAAVERGPENAGPLNSHRLVLRSLALMRSLSPDYLRRFLSQAETLMGLEEVAKRQREPAARPRGNARVARKRS